MLYSASELSDLLHPSCRIHRRDFRGLPGDGDAEKFFELLTQTLREPVQIGHGLTVGDQAHMHLTAVGRHGDRQGLSAASGAIG